MVLATKKGRSLRSKKADVRREEVINNAPKLLSAFSVGDVSYQGDLIIVGIAAVSASAKLRENRQLADGNTQGSRHVLERGELFDCEASDVIEAIRAATGVTVEVEYVGPVFVSPDDPTEHDLTHPEHGHQGFAAGQVCAVVYQRNLDSEQRERRVLD